MTHNLLPQEVKDNEKSMSPIQIITTFFVIPFLISHKNIDYDIDASTSTLLINMANQNLNAYIPKEDFSDLSPEVR